MATLNLGKILVVRSDSTKSASNVKKLTNSKTAVEHKINSRTKEDVKEFFQCILDAFQLLSGEHSEYAENFKFFELDKNAVSTMYRLADDKFHSTLEITQAEYIELQALVRAMKAIESANHFYSMGLKQHEFLVAHLKGTKVKSSLVKNCDADIEAAKTSLIDIANDIVTRMDKILDKSW